MKKGFTLIELLVVIAIIGILASIVLASLNTASKRSDAKYVICSGTTDSNDCIYALSFSRFDNCLRIKEVGDSDVDVCGNYTIKENKQ